VEIKRERLGTGGGASGSTPGAGAQPSDTPGAGSVDPRALRVNTLDSHELLRGAELLGPTQPATMEGEELERYVHERVLTTTLEKAVAWGRSNSFFPLAFGLACCAMEQFQAAGPRLDIARFGYEAFRASPRQADLIILAGRVSIKMAPIIRRLYDQMLEPKWAISMGACCSSMGVFNNYALVPSDKFMPIDVHVPGCPPRPEGLMHGILKLRAMVQDDPDAGWRERYGAQGTEEILPGA
jgi:NADH-quinone oxidoreductase subunit B